jgi:hypothetical protein
MDKGKGSDPNSMEYGLQYNPPMKLDVAERNLKEAKRVFDQMGLVIMLGAGTCLEAIRDKSLIPWDDDIDLYSVMGVNGLTENSIASALAEFRRKGYFIKQHYSVSDGPPYAISHSFIKIMHVSIGFALMWSMIPYGFIRGFRFPLIFLLILKR